MLAPPLTPSAPNATMNIEHATLTTEYISERFLCPSAALRGVHHPTDVNRSVCLASRSGGNPVHLRPPEGETALMTKLVSIILNPASGKDLPVLSILNTAFGHDVDWNISVTHNPAMRGATPSGRSLTASTSSQPTVATDGREVVQVLAGCDVPLAILSGGTGNGVAGS